MKKLNYHNYFDGKFADIEMYNSSCLFIEQHYSPDHDTRGYVREICQKACITILKYLANIYIEEVSSDFIIQLTSTHNFKKGEALVINRFLLFMVDSGKLQNDIIKRITLFRRKLNKHFQPYYFDSIFNCKRFNEFLSNNSLKGSLGITVFFMKIPKENFIEERLYEALSEKLEEVKFKFNSDYAAKAFCTEFIIIAKEVFANIKLADITLKHLHAFMVKNKKSVYNIAKRLSEMLVYLESNCLIEDEGVLHLLSFKEYLLSASCTLSKLIELTSCKNIKRFIYFDGSYGQKRNLQYINIECQEIFDVWVKFYLDTNYKACITRFKTICTEFDNSLSGFTIESLQDLNFDTYFSQIMYFSKYAGKPRSYSSASSYITGFYIFLSQNYNPNIFKESNVDIKLLQRPQIEKELLDDYKIINYNPMEDVPKADKWILSYNDMQNINSEVNTTTSKIVDCTKIKSKIYRYWIKHYIWKAKTNIFTKLENMYNLIEFVNYIYDLKHGIRLSIYARKTLDEGISSNEALAYKNYILNKTLKSKSQSVIIHRANKFLKHVSLNELEKIETGVFYNLKHEAGNEINAEALSNDEVRKLSELMKRKAQISIENEVYYAILCLTLETEFRSSQIFALTIDCIQEANKRNQYILISKTKTSKGELLPQAITIGTKRLLEHIIKLTSEFRKNCNIESLKNQIFLLPARRRGAHKIVSWGNFDRYLKACCDELGLKRYSLGNLRDTYMTKVEKYIVEKGLSDMTKKVLSGHVNPRSDKGYEDTNIRTLLEAVHGIIIGNVDIKGKILKEVTAEIATDANTVCHQCGYCAAESCHDLSYLDCLLCSDFIATISRIPFFKEQIKVIDKNLSSATIRHDKEDLVNIKRLLLEFLTRLLALQQEFENEEFKDIERKID
jgi:integrase